MRRIVLVAIALAQLACGSNSAPTNPSLGQIRYDISGTATNVDITYENENGSTSQIGAAPLPWSYAWSGAKHGDFLYISAQIVNVSGGAITVTITKDGTLFKSASASGFPSIATASGSY